MRLIDADALEKAINEWFPKDQETWMESDIPPIENLVVSIMMTIEEQPTINAVPSETLYDFIKELGSITYGKERFFRQDNGTWYDREHADYITLDDVIRRIVDAVRELDDSELFQRELWDRECEDD